MNASIKSPERSSQFGFCNFRSSVFNLLCAVFLFPCAKPLCAEDATWTYTVQLSAMVQISPPQITLNWLNNDPYGVQSFNIYRKAKDATSWDFLTSLGPSTFSWL